jgi:hypothetical protein
LPSTLPVLVLGGELDTWTPPVDHPQVLAEIGGDARFIEIANSTHVVGETDTVCGSILVQRFVRSPANVTTMPDSCAAAEPPIHAVGVYPRTLAQEPEITPARGFAAGEQELRLAAAAVSTAGDAIARRQAASPVVDHGLAGGTVTAAAGGSVLTLNGDRLIPGVSVSGTVRLAPASDAQDGELVTATLTAKASGVPGATLTATWTTAGAGAMASVAGSVAGQPLAGTLPAP